MSSYSMEIFKKTTKHDRISKSRTRSFSLLFTLLIVDTLIHEIPDREGDVIVIYIIKIRGNDELISIDREVDRWIRRSGLVQDLASALSRARRSNRSNFGLWNASRHYIITWNVMLHRYAMKQRPVPRTRPCKMDRSRL